MLRQLLTAPNQLTLLRLIFIPFIIINIVDHHYGWALILLAAAGGEVFRLDPATGEGIWHNKLKGLGRGIVSLASLRAPATGSESMAAAAKRIRDEQTAAAATAAG